MEGSKKQWIGGLKNATVFACEDFQKAKRIFEIQTKAERFFLEHGSLGDGLSPKIPENSQTIFAVVIR